MLTGGCGGWVGKDGSGEGPSRGDGLIWTLVSLSRLPGARVSFESEICEAGLRWPGAGLVYQQASGGLSDIVI